MGSGEDSPHRKSRTIPRSTGETIGCAAGILGILSRRNKDRCLRRMIDCD